MRDAASCLSTNLQKSGVNCSVVKFGDAKAVLLCECNSKRNDCTSRYLGKMRDKIALAFFCVHLFLVSFDVLLTSAHFARHKLEQDQRQAIIFHLFMHLFSSCCVVDCGCGVVYNSPLV